MPCRVASATPDAPHALAAWERLWESAPEQFITTSTQWLRLWQEAFSVTDTRIFQVERDGQPVTIAPLTISGGSAAFPYTSDLVDYNDFTYAPGEHLAEALSALLRHLADSGAAQSMLLQSVPEDAPSVAALEHAATDSGWTFRAEREEASPRAALPESWESYMAGLRSKDRHELRRKTRRLEAAGELEHTALEDPREMERAAPALLQLIKISSEAKEEYMNQQREQFFKLMITRLAHSGRLVMHNLKLDGRLLAASVSFITARTLYLYNSGYDPAHRQVAPGLINHLLAVKWAMGRGIKCFDFMRGDERYKYHLGGADRWLLRLELRSGGGGAAA